MNSVAFLDSVSKKADMLFLGNVFNWLSSYNAICKDIIYKLVSKLANVGYFKRKFGQKFPCLIRTNGHTNELVYANGTCECLNHANDA